MQTYYKTMQCFIFERKTEKWKENTFKISKNMHRYAKHKKGYLESKTVFNV